MHAESLLTDSSNAAACILRYDPFGILEQAASDANPCNVGASQNNERFYRGARRDSTMGTYQFGARVYDPKKAGFLTPDSYRAASPATDLSVGVDPLTRNTYAYVNGDPVNAVDPDGHHIAPDGADCLFSCSGNNNPMLRIDFQGKLGTLSLYQSMALNERNGGAMGCPLGAHAEITVWGPHQTGCGVWVAGTHAHSIRQGIANVAGGMLNIFTLGSARDVLSTFHQEDKVDYASSSYHAGEAVGALAAAAVVVVAAVASSPVLAARLAVAAGCLGARLATLGSATPEVANEGEAVAADLEASAAAETEGATAALLKHLAGAVERLNVAGLTEAQKDALIDNPGLWWDVTTDGSWAGHVAKYSNPFGEGIPLFTP